MSPKQWVFNPDRGGVKIPDVVKRRTEERIRRYADEHFAGRFTRLHFRFRGQFCYIDAFTEPALPGPNWPPPDWPETREEFIGRLRNTPVHLCRLRYFGSDDRWGFAAYSYAHEKYESTVLPSGQFSGRAEEAFHAMAELHLSE